MAKKKDNKILGLALLGVAAYFVLSGRQRFTPNPVYPNIPPEPVTGSPQWYQWVNLVIQTAGGITTRLFGPGGPFEGMTLREVLQGQQQATGAPEIINPWTGQPIGPGDQIPECPPGSPINPWTGKPIC